MAEKVLAAVRVATAKTEIREYPMPDVPEDGALMKMEVAGICGTDVRLYHEPPNNKPTIMRWTYSNSSSKGSLIFMAPCIQGVPKCK